MVSQKENRMKITMSWPGNRKTPKEKRVVHKPKIRWQQLGLKDLSEEPASVSMDEIRRQVVVASGRGLGHAVRSRAGEPSGPATRSEEHTSELQSQSNLVCRLLLEKKKQKITVAYTFCTAARYPYCYLCALCSTTPSILSQLRHVVLLSGSAEYWMRIISPSP